MADISKIEINNVSYNIKDATARQMIENLPTGGTGSGGDWAQNDPLGDGYIKHRTHWKEEIGGEILLPETTVQFSGSGTTLTSATAAADALAEGDKVSVFWNGTKYVCEAFTYFGYSCLGNASLNNPSAEDTGEPFLFIFQRGGNVTINKKSSAAETITIKVGDKDTIYHKLPGEFLPDGVPYVEKGMVEILPNTHIDEAYNGYAFPEPIGFVEGKIYKVIWNGTSYECPVVTMEEGGLLTLGIGDPNEKDTYPFGIFDVPEEMRGELGFGAMLSCDDMEADVSIYTEGEVVHKIDSRCLPDNIGGSGGFFLVTADALAMTADKTCDEIYQAVMNGQSVVLSANNGAQIAPLNDCIPGKGAFFVLHTVSSVEENGVPNITGIVGSSTICVKRDGSILLK